MASIEKYRTKRGQLNWRVRYRTQEGNQTSKSGFKTRRDAEIFEATVTISILDGSYIAPAKGKITVAELYPDWYAGLTVSDNTKRARRQAWHNHVEPRWGKVRISNVTNSEVNKWVATMNGNGVGVPTQEYAVGVLRMIFKYAIANGYVKSNPVTDVRLKRRNQKPRPYLTPPQVALLATHLGDKGEIATFLAYTGLRWGECAALRGSDVDFNRKRLYVTHSFDFDHRKLKDPKHGARDFPLPQTICDMIAARVAGKDPQTLVFPNNRGTYFDDGNFGKQYLKPAIKKCCADDPHFPAGLTIHDLRHTAASIAVSSGANVLSLQKMLGHASAAMTLDVYSDLFDSDAVQTASNIDRVMQRWAS